jgi:hypothetical protein
MLFITNMLRNFKAEISLIRGLKISSYPIVNTLRSFILFADDANGDDIEIAILYELLARVKGGFVSY